MSFPGHAALFYIPDCEVRVRLIARCPAYGMFMAFPSSILSAACCRPILSNSALHPTRYTHHFLNSSLIYWILVLFDPSRIRLSLRLPSPNPQTPFSALERPKTLSAPPIAHRDSRLSTLHFLPLSRLPFLSLHPSETIRWAADWGMRVRRRCRQGVRRGAAQL